MKTIHCPSCKGRMKKSSAGNTTGILLGLILVVCGILLCFTLVGALIGIPMILVGGGMGGKKTWKCRECGYAMPRL